MILFISFFLGGDSLLPAGEIVRGSLVQAARPASSIPRTPGCVLLCAGADERNLTGYATLPQRSTVPMCKRLLTPDSRLRTQDSGLRTPDSGLYFLTPSTMLVPKLSRSGMMRATSRPDLS